MSINTTAYDAAEYLDDEETIVFYLGEALETGDSKLINIAIGNVARAKGMTDLAQKIGVSRESLYRSFSGEGNPSFATVLRIVDAFGMRLDVKQKRTSNPETEAA